MDIKNKSVSEGAIVKLKNPVDYAESKAFFKVVENKGDRINIMLLNTEMPFLPIECVNINEVVIIKDKN